MKVGAQYLGENECEFTVWAPKLSGVAVQIVSPKSRLIPMQLQAQGYWHVKAIDISPDTSYLYKLEGGVEHPDPASYFQPQGVHSPSQVIDHRRFEWSDRSWANISLDEYIIYEIHVGTFTPEGAFAAIIPRLPDLYQLGVNAIEIMPVAQFPGDRNWGYDGVYLYAVQNSYGGPDGLKQLVSACHQQGIAVILDVVYNHFGPEGNYVNQFGSYSTDMYHSLWGDAVNFDQAYCDGVRNFCLENALYWFETYHIDALRLDAVQGIYDMSAKHFLQELAERVVEFSQQHDRPYYLMAESDLNDVRLIRPWERGGYGIDVQWCDDFHHGLHTLLTGESDRYYQDFGTCEQLAKSYREGFIYSGQYSTDRRKHHGNSSQAEPAAQFLVCSQNHDQVGNRLLGDRLSHIVSFSGAKLAAGAVLLSPYLPLLFMGEEYGEDAPFLYFVSHSDPALIQAVRQGKQAEHKYTNHWEECPDPQALETFVKCRLQWEKRTKGKYRVLWSFYQRLIQLRRSIPALKHLSKNHLEVSFIESDKVIFLHRWFKQSHTFCILNFNQHETRFSTQLPDYSWQKVLDSAEANWLGEGSDLPQMLKPDQKITIKPQSLALYEGNQ